MSSSVQSMYSDFYDAVMCLQEVARNSPGVLPYLGKELEERGTRADTQAIPECEAAVSRLVYAGCTDADLQSLGAALASKRAASSLEGINVLQHLKPDPDVRPAQALADHLRRPVGNAAASRPSAAPESAKRRAEAVWNRDGVDASVRVPVRDSPAVKTAAVAAGVVLLVYAAVRFYDIAHLDGRERDGWRTFYRVVVALVEVLFGVTAVVATASRVRRPAVLPEMIEASDSTWAPAELITVLMVTDEDAATIAASVRSHYGAVRPEGVPFRVVVCAEEDSAAVQKAAEALMPEFPSLLIFDYQSLADQAWLADVASTQPLAAKNLLIAQHMGFGQALFYTLDRLQLQFGHAVSDAGVCVMDGSSVVDAEYYYGYAASALQRVGVAVVSTPTAARNRPAAGDFLDTAGRLQELVAVTGALADHKCAIGTRAFMARGYSLVRMLRRMELENVDSNNLDWAMYCMHSEARQATLGLYTLNAPITSVLTHTNAATIISRALLHSAEAFDVHAIFSREKAFISWEPFNPLASPHHSARMAAVMELTVLVAVVLSTAANLAPWSTDSTLVAAAFLLYYLLMMFNHVLTPYGVRWSLASTALRNRILAPLNMWLYFVDLSRFGAPPKMSILCPAGV